MKRSTSHCTAQRFNALCVQLLFTVLKMLSSVMMTTTIVLVDACLPTRSDNNFFHFTYIIIIFVTFALSHYAHRLRSQFAHKYALLVFFILTQDRQFFIYNVLYDASRAYTHIHAVIHACISQTVCSLDETA